METAKYQCLFVDWFTFNTRCPIKTCKFNSRKVESGCLFINRRFPDSSKLISDQELLYYKYNKETDLKTVISNKRKAIFNVKSILILYAYVEYIKDHYTGKRKFVRSYSSIFSASPLLTIEKLGIEEWMIPYLFSEKTYRKFIKQYQKGDCKNFRLNSILGLNSNRFYKIKAEIFSQAPL